MFKKCLLNVFRARLPLVVAALLFTSPFSILHMLNYTIFALVLNIYTIF